MLGWEWGWKCPCHESLLLKKTCHHVYSPQASGKPCVWGHLRASSWMDMKNLIGANNRNLQRFKSCLNCFPLESWSWILEGHQSLCVVLNPGQMQAFYHTPQMPRVPLYPLIEKSVGGSWPVSQISSMDTTENAIYRYVPPCSHPPTN